jgi:hypothetical protein
MRLCSYVESKETTMITDKAFQDAVLRFKAEESRGSFYDMAVSLFNSGFKTEAYLLLLATWNFASFQYAVTKFDLVAFKSTVKSLEANFQHLDGKDIRTADFDSLREDVAVIYNALSQIKGIKYTGASKMMHLRNRELFVMWDGYIRGQKPRKDYERLDIVKRGDWDIKEYGDSAADYLEFLRDMQNRFGSVSFRENGKSFAKAIDEFNYVSITLSLQRLQKAADRSPEKGISVAVADPVGSGLTHVPKVGDFRRVLDEKLSSGMDDHIDVNAGELHDLVGKRSGKDSRMPTCCDVMRATMRAGDTILAQPLQGKGSSLTIRYRLPR